MSEDQFKKKYMKYKKKCYELQMKLRKRGALLSLLRDMIDTHKGDDHDELSESNSVCSDQSSLATSTPEESHSDEEDIDVESVSPHDSVSSEHDSTVLGKKRPHSYESDMEDNAENFEPGGNKWECMSLTDEGSDTA